MAAPRNNNAFALASIMSPAPTKTTGQKRKADEAGMADLSLDALSAAAAAAAASISAPIDSSTLPGPRAQSVTTVITSQTSTSSVNDVVMATVVTDEADPSKFSNHYGGAPPVPPTGTAYFMDSNGDEGYGDDGGIIRCICGWDDDDGFTVQCDRCLVWQHCACFGMDQDSLPESYMCEQCQPRPVDVDFARNLQHRRKLEEARNKEIEEQRELALVARRNQTPSLSVSTTPKGLPEALPPLPSAKENRGRKSSQSIDNSTSVEGDYFSTPAGASSSAVTAPTTKSAKRKSGTSSSKSSKKPSMTVVPAPIAEAVPLPSITTPRDNSRMRDDDDILDAQERFEAWHIEYTPIAANIYSDRQTRARLDAAAASVQVEPSSADYNGPSSSRLRAFEVGTGKIMAPLADPAGEEEAANRDSTRIPLHPQLGALPIDSGLSVVGNECVPIEIEAASLAEIAQKATVRYIPEGVAAGMFAQIQGMSPDSFPNLAAASHYSRHQQAWGASPYVPRPTMHGLYADVAINAGTFICEYRGEITDGDAYRADPVNQYAALGTTKPHVHILPPPLNVAIDARRYGTEARFARPSCHPNSVLRPVLLRPPPRDQDRDEKPLQEGNADAVFASKEGSPSTLPRKELLFGIFAISDINRGHEITLGWEWDDLHIVHFLPELVKEPPRVSRRAVSPVKDTALEPISFPYAGTPVAAKMDAVSSSICSVTLCACLGPASSNSSSLAAAAATYINPTQLTQSNLRKQDCALAQMVRVAHGMELLQVIPSAKSHRKLRPPDFSPLIGRRRWWRPLPLPLTPSESTKVEEPRKARGGAGSNGDVDMEDASRHSGSDEDDDDEDRRSEASSLTEPLSDSMEAGLDEEMAEVSISASGKATSSSRGKQKRESLDVEGHDEDDDEDRPTILPLKKRVAGTRLKATYFDAELASDGSDGDHMDLLSKSALKARKQAGRVRTTSRSTNIAKDARRRPIRSTLDSADEASDSERRKAKAAKMAQKREAKIQAKIMSKPKKDKHQPSSPLSSLSSQASLSSLDESPDESDDGSSGGSGDEDESGSESEESDGSSSGSESESSDSSGSDSDSTDQSGSEALDRASRRAGEPRPKKSNSLQKRARKRTAKFRADIAALGDADTSSDDSAIPAGQRKRSHKPSSDMVRKDKGTDPDSDKRARGKKKTKHSLEKRDKGSAKRKETSKQRAENTRVQRRKEDSSENRGSAPKQRKVPSDRHGDAPEGPPVVRKTKPRLRPASPTSESESGSQEDDEHDDEAAAVEVQRKALKMQLDFPDDSTEVRRSGAVTSEAATAVPALTSNNSFANVVVKSEDTSMAASIPEEIKSQADHPSATSTAAPAPLAPPAPPKPEPPRKKLSLADYKRRLAEQKVTEQVTTPAIPETPVGEAAPTPSSETPAAVTSANDSGTTEGGDLKPALTLGSVQSGPITAIAPSVASASSERPVEPLGPPPASPERSRPRILSRAFPPLSPSEDRRETELASALSNAPVSQYAQAPRYGGAIPATELKREQSPTRPEHFERRPHASLGPAWSSTSISDRPRYGRVSDPSEPPSQPPSARLGSGFRPANTVSTSAFASESPTRPELSIAGRASGAIGLTRGPPSATGPSGGSSNMHGAPAGVQTFNPPRGPRALMGSSLMAPPNSAGPLSRDLPSSAGGPNSTPIVTTSSVSSNPMPPPGSLSSRLVPPSPGGAASGANKIGGSSGGTGWSRVPMHSSGMPPPGASLPSSSAATGPSFASSSTPSHFTERTSISSASSSGATPASLRADLMNFDGVPKGPASMRAESSGSSSYEDYEYFGGRDRGRGGWRGPRVRKRGGGRGRGWGMRQ